MRTLLRPLLAEPAVADAPRRVWRDRVLVGVSCCAAVIEALLRPDLPWRWPTLVIALVVLGSLLWRRTYPLAVTIACFGTMLVLTVVQLVAGVDGTTGLYTMAVLLVSLYSLVRWASGRDIVIGVSVAILTGAVSIVADYTGVSDAIGGYAVLGITIAIAAAVRFGRRSRERELEQVRLLEREQIARDLHDIVAHHVSAITIRAQAGIAVAPTDPRAALDALHVIESEATKTLSEMRSIVGVLRRDSPAELAPTPTLHDVQRLAVAGTGAPADIPVDVMVTGDVDDVAPAVATAIFRLAQESVTNARRHAQRATRVAVAVTGDGEHVHLSVCDDGAPVLGRGTARGYGIAGMIERAHLLGGEVVAGPDPRRGWRVTAWLPRDGSRA